MRFGPMEIGLILVIVLIVFGVGKLPQVGSALGKSIHAFKQAQNGQDDGTKGVEMAAAKDAARKPEKS